MPTVITAGTNKAHTESVLLIFWGAPCSSSKKKFSTTKPLDWHWSDRKPTMREVEVECLGALVGKTSSGVYSFNYKKSISMGHVKLDEIFKLSDITNNSFEIEVAKKRYKAELNLQPMHDAKNILIKK